MKYFSMFSGIGGFELGIQRAFNKQSTPFEQDGQGTNGDSDEVEHDVLPTSRTTPLCVGYSEIDKYAIKVYERNFNGHTNYGDATKIDPSSLPDFDLLVGGFPCQAFSVAGKRMGFDDTRGTLFFDIARILAEKRPRHLVLENVKGLLSHDSGKTFQTILGVLSDLGYRVEWQVLNSKDFGVPQNRERVYIIGHLGNQCVRQVFPINGTNGADIVQINNPVHSNDRVYDTSGISPTLNTMQGGNRQPFVASVLTPDRVEKRQNGRRIKDDGEPSFTVTSQDRHGILTASRLVSYNRNDGVKGEIDVAHTLSSSDYRGLNRNQDQNAVLEDVRIRRLTPTECERLQGFPDDWTAGESDTQRYKMCGNAVTVNVVEAVIGSLICAEGEL
jgi:DNA (cytosine-5)-methyltransferase 1